MVVIFNGERVVGHATLGGEIFLSATKSKMSECGMQGGKRTLLVKYLPWSRWSGDLTTPSLKAERIGLLRYYDLGILT